MFLLLRHGVAPLGVLPLAVLLIVVIVDFEVMIFVAVAPGPAVLAIAGSTATTAAPTVVSLQGDHGGTCSRT